LSKREDVYLSALERKNVEPNFFCSEDYWKYAGWKAVLDGKYLIVVDEDGKNMLPAFDIVEERFDYDEMDFWAGFPDYNKGKFLDYEFIYDPGSFMNLEGKRWKLFRKNIRKFRNEVEAELILSKEVDEDVLKSFLDRWVKENEGKNWYEPEVMFRTIFETGKRMFLYGRESGKLYSIMIWDRNYMYINFRYLLTLDYPKLQDISRLFFYRWAFHQGLVNDGGCLDSEGLEWYKKRLNPTKINTIYSREA